MVFDTTIPALRRIASIAVALCAVTAASAAPQEFTYQALITNNAGQPATSTNTSITLTLFNAASGGTFLKTQDFPAQNLSSTGGYVSLTVSAASLDLSGNVYAEVAVRDVAGAGSVETLTPRQKLTSAPFALQANTLVPTYPWANRTLFVNPGTIAASANPTGSIADPFNNIQAAYNKAKTMGSSYTNRVVVMLMPGNHVVNSPVVLDAQSIDIAGFGEKSAAVTGTADPLFNATATGSTGVTIRNLILQVPDAASNRALVIADGRVENVAISRSATAVAGNLVDVNATAACSFKDFEIAGGVTINSYGPQTTFTNGYISGIVNSTGASAAATDFVAFVNLASIGGINFNPAGGLGFGAVSFANVQLVGSISYGANTVIRASSTAFVNASFVPLALPNPLPGSILGNCMGNAAAWTGTVASLGNIPGVFSAFLSK